MNDPERVLCVKLLAAIGSIPGDEPPQIIEIEAVGAIAVLLENLSFIPYSAASGHAPLSSARVFDAAFSPVDHQAMF